MALGLMAFLFLALPFAAKPPVSWEPPAIYLGVPAGEELRTEVVAHVAEGVECADLDVTPFLAPYGASIQTATLPANSAGAEVIVELRFAVPAQETLTEIDGTLHIREDRAPPLRPD